MYIYIFRGVSKKNILPVAICYTSMLQSAMEHILRLTGCIIRKVFKIILNGQRTARI